VRAQHRRVRERAVVRGVEERGVGRRVGEEEGEARGQLVRRERDDAGGAGAALRAVDEGRRLEEVLQHRAEALRGRLVGAQRGVERVDAGALGRRQRAAKGAAPEVVDEGAHAGVHLRVGEARAERRTELREERGRAGEEGVGQQLRAVLERQLVLRADGGVVGVGGEARREARLRGGARVARARDEGVGERAGEECAQRVLVLHAVEAAEADQPQLGRDVAAAAAARPASAAGRSLTQRPDDGALAGTEGEEGRAGEQRAHHPHRALSGVTRLIARVGVFGRVISEG
jgi:hypothetical protein